MALLALSKAHRRDLAELTGIAEHDVALMWRQFDTAEAARDGLLDLLPRLVAIYGAAAATLGADWYDEVRESVAARGRFRAIPAELPDTGRTDSLARWAVGPMFQPQPDREAALTLVQGGLQRIISDADRGSVTVSAVQDPSAAGWQRIGGGGCGFCAMLVERGAVYSEATADFASHDHCRCAAVPVFDGTKPISVRDFTPTARNITDADRARARAYIREHHT